MAKIDKDKPYTQAAIIHMLKQGGKSFEDASLYLFESNKGFIYKINQKLKLNEGQIHDAYADALVKLVRHLKNDTFRGESKISSYFYTIFYNTAVDVSRKNTSNKNIDTIELLEFDAKEKDLLSIVDAKDEAFHVIKLMNSIGQNCKKILLDWAFYGYSMDEIAIRSSLKNAETARSMKYKCLKKLRSIISERL